MSHNLITLSVPEVSSHPLVASNARARCYVCCHGRWPWAHVPRLYGLVAAVTHSHFKLEAHQRDGGALGAALAADRLPALPAVVLSQANFLTVPHLLEFQKRAGHTFGRNRCPTIQGLLPFHVHVPDDNPTVTTTGDELPRVLCIGQGLDFVIVSLELDGCSFPPADVPHDDRVIGAPRTAPAGRVPAEQSPHLCVLGML